MKPITIVLCAWLVVISLGLSSQNQPGNNLFEFMINYYHDNPYQLPGDTSKRSGFAKDYDRRSPSGAPGFTRMVIFRWLWRRYPIIIRIF
jgi:hypothetical protein